MKLVEYFTKERILTIQGNEKSVDGRQLFE